MSNCDVAIVGAGPYGLSAAAHLANRGRNVQVFGDCMSFWRRNMPQGMFLRSPWAACHLSDPGGAFTLDAFQSSSRTQFSSPVPLEHFIAYGHWFQRQAVPAVDPRKVVSVELRNGTFALRLEDGETVSAIRVVVAGGIVPFAWQPPQFGGLSQDLVSHSSTWDDLSRLAGKRIAVIGGGQSALESAALLHEAGAKVELIVRNHRIIWLHQNPFLHQWPISAALYAWPDVGPALVSHVVARPILFQSLPRPLQDKLAPRAIRAAGAQWLKGRVHEVLPITAGRTVESAAACGREMKLRLDDGSERKVDHVLLGTGYRVNIARYSFLAPELLRAIASVNGYPVLDGAFGCSVSGLHFLGAPAAWSFGPLMRFVAGAGFAARRLSQGITQPGS